MKKNLLINKIKAHFNELFANFDIISNSNSKNITISDYEVIFKTLYIELQNELQNLMAPK
jgi:hypothetical protein